MNVRLHIQKLVRLDLRIESVTQYALYIKQHIHFIESREISMSTKNLRHLEGMLNNEALSFGENVWSH